MKNFKIILFSAVAVLALSANAQEDKNKKVMKDEVDGWSQTKELREATKRAIDNAKVDENALRKAI